MAVWAHPIVVGGAAPDFRAAVAGRRRIAGMVDRVPDRVRRARRRGRLAPLGGAGLALARQALPSSARLSWPRWLSSCHAINVTMSLIVMGPRVAWIPARFHCSGVRAR